jgi:multiple sugar transport system substrate-binding protein
MTARTSTFSRRRMLGLAGAALGVGAVGAVAGCGSPVAAGVLGASPQSGTTTFWNLWGGSDGDRAADMYDAYRGSHGGAASLEAVTFAWGNPYYTKLSLATIGKRPPDIAVAHASRLPTLARAGLVEEVTAADLAAMHLGEQDFTPTAWKAVNIDGTLRAVPFDVGPIALFYNTDLCAKAGLLGPDGRLVPITGADEFDRALTAAERAGAKNGAVWSVVGDVGMNWRWFQTLYAQKNGAPFLGDEGHAVTFDDDIAAQTLEYLARMTGPQGFAPAEIDYAGALSTFGNGDAAFLVMGAWEVTTMVDVGVPFAMTTLPQLFDTHVVWADSHVLVLPTQPGRSPDNRARALGFARFMLDDSLTWAGGGSIPGLRSLQQSQGYRDLKPQSDYAGSADLAVYDPTAWYSGAGSNFQTVTGSQIGLVQQGLVSARDAVAAMRSQLTRYADTPDPL